MKCVCVCGKSFPVPHAAAREVQGKEMKRARGPLRSLYELEESWKKGCDVCWVWKDFVLAQWQEDLNRVRETSRRRVREEHRSR